MKSNFLLNIFKKRKKKNKLTTPDSILVKKLKSICLENNYNVLENISIYHHSDSINIPLMVLDPKRGLYIFEYKDWSYEDLNKYELQKSHNNEQSKNTLAYDKISNFINLKYNEILHNDCVKVFNYLLTENLTYKDYQHLSQEKKELLPNEKIIFSDTDEFDILKKLNDCCDIDDNLESSSFILANLLTQYLVLNKRIATLATEEQIAYIDDSLDYNDNVGIISLNGLAQSGKTSTLILKAIYLKLLSEQNSVTIIEPTALSCDIVKQSILELIEYSIINIDVTSINVYTPDEFLNSKASLYVFCDDASLIEDLKLEEIILKSAKSKLTLVNPTESYEHFYKLTKSFHTKIDIEFLQQNPFAKAMHLIEDNIKLDKTVLCASSLDSSEKLSEDLSSYLDNDTVLLDSSKKLIDQDKRPLTVCDYQNIYAQRNDIVILLDVCELSIQELSYAINLANEKVYIVYQDECDNIITLKKIFSKE